MSVPACLHVYVRVRVCFGVPLDLTHSPLNIVNNEGDMKHNNNRVENEKVTGEKPR